MLGAASVCFALMQLIGCSKVPFTLAVRERFALTADDLLHIQFFNSDEIVLQRELAASARMVNGGELVMREGVRIEQLTIDMRTPCVALRVEDDYLLVGFSPKDLGASLWFHLDRDGGANRNREPHYELVALENILTEPPPFEPHWSKGFLVTWSGKQYHVTAGREAYLLYEEGSFERDKVETSAPGFRLSERASPPKQTGTGKPEPKPAPPQEQPPPAVRDGGVPYEL